MTNKKSLLAAFNCSFAVSAFVPTVVAAKEVARATVVKLQGAWQAVQVHSD